MALSGIATSNGSNGSSNGSNSNAGELDRLLPLVRVKVDGTVLAVKWRDRLLDINVENSLHLPDMATIVLQDNDFDLAGSDVFDIGS
jgi:hypothetical protein